MVEAYRREELELDALCVPSLLAGSRRCASLRQTFGDNFAAIEMEKSERRLSLLSIVKRESKTMRRGNRAGRKHHKS